MIEEHEKRLLEFLSNQENYLYKPEFVKIVQTHISIIALAPPFAFKVKKKHKLDFLDYSTLEKRKYFIEQELKLNKRLCDGIYLEMLPIYMKKAELSFVPTDEIYEYALKMRYLNPENCLRKLLLDNRYSETLENQIVQSLTNFYKSQKPIKSDGKSFEDSLQLPIITNVKELEHYQNNILSKIVMDTLNYYTETFYKIFSNYFKKRIAEGYIRDCHGDLRLEHIYISKDKVCIYDCIEFNDSFRHIDIANDLAFLGMEFDFCNHSTEGASLIKKIFSQIQDNTGIGLLNFYKVYRALVRAKVNFILSNEDEIGQNKRRESESLAIKYTQLALSYIVSKVLPTIIIVMGKTGTGKSTVSRELSRNLGAKIFSTDYLRKQMANIDPFKETPDELKTVIYSSEFSMKVYRKIIQDALSFLKSQRVVILDGTFSKKIYRSMILENLKSNRIIFIELCSNSEVSSNRLKLRENAVSISDARLKDKDTIDSLYEMPTEIPERMLVSVSNNSDLEQSLKLIFKKIIDNSIADDEKNWLSNE